MVGFEAIEQREREEHNKKTPWYWVPSLYFAEGIPYIITMTVSVIMYKRMGISNSVIAFWTSVLYLPWVIKPLWGPLVDTKSTKRKWIWSCQALIGVSLTAIALVLHLPFFFSLTIIFFFILAFTSATHDIAADGFYILGLSEHKQAWFVGIRSTFYRLAMLTGQGLIVILAGYLETVTGLPPVDVTINTTLTPKHINTETKILERSPDELYLIADPQIITHPIGETDSIPVEFRLSKAPENNDEIVVNLSKSDGSSDISIVSGSRMVFNHDNWNKNQISMFKVDPRQKNPTSTVFQATSGNVGLSWSISFLFLAAMFFIFFIYHRYVLPYPAKDEDRDKDKDKSESKAPFKEVFKSFFAKKDIVPIVSFLIFFRFAESQLVKIASPFLLDGQDKGGLGLSTGEVGFAYGTVGLAALTLGGILGGFVAAKQGLKKWIWWMALAINIPDAVYIFLSSNLPDEIWVINSCIAIEQFGYGFGFTAYMLFMIYAARGKYQTAHYAICTGLMALGMMLPGMISGAVQEWLGYQMFFIWVIISTVIAMIPIYFVNIDPEFGKK